MDIRKFFKGKLAINFLCRFLKFQDISTTLNSIKIYWSRNSIYNYTYSGYVILFVSKKSRLQNSP